MTRITKNIGLFAMIPLFTIMLLASYTGPSFAEQAQDQKPSAKVDRVLFQGQGWYEVRLTVNAGTEDILSGKVSITSDISSRDIELQKIGANSFVNLRTTIQANDRNSISVELSEIRQKQDQAVLSRTNSAIANDQNLDLNINNVLFKGQSRYEVRLTLSVGDEDFFGGKIRITSDTSSKEIELQRMNANSSVDLITTIHADSRDSISAAVTQVNKRQGPSVSYIGSTPVIGGENGEYWAQFRVYAGDDNVSKVHLNIQSDRDAIKIVASGNNISRNSGFIGAHTYAITTVKLKADDPTSIKASILDYQIN